MPDRPQFAWPFAFVTQPDGSMTVGEVEQGTPAERVASAAVVISTRRRQRMDDPSFGITPLTFQQGAIDTHRLTAEIEQSDPRLDLDADELLDLADATSRVITTNVAPAEG